MDPIAISAASALRSRIESLELLANNLANAGTDGYKADYEQYNLYFSPDAANPSGSSTGLPVIQKPWTDFAQGVLKSTGNPLDLALAGKGFFTVNGPSGPLYTRNGAFQLSPGGKVTTAEGYTVRLEDGGALETTSDAPLEVSVDGTVRQGTSVLGKLAVADFSSNDAIGKIGKNYFQVTDSNTTATASTAQVHQGKVEGSNSGTPETAVRLIGIMRQFEMLQKAVSITGEMDRRSIEEVGKVGS